MLLTGLRASASSSLRCFLESKKNKTSSLLGIYNGFSKSNKPNKCMTCQLNTTNSLNNLTSSACSFRPKIRRPSNFKHRTSNIQLYTVQCLLTVLETYKPSITEQKKKPFLTNHKLFRIRLPKIIIAGLAVLDVDKLLRRKLFAQKVKAY